MYYRNTQYPRARRTTHEDNVRIFKETFKGIFLKKKKLLQ